MKKIGLVFILLAITGTAFSAGVIKVDTVRSSTVDSSYQNMNEDQREALLIQKLTPDQLLELERIRNRSSHSNIPFSSFGILLVSLMPFLTVLLVVYFVMRYKRQNEQQRLRLYEKSIEAGKELPDSFFKKPDNEVHSNLLKGMIWTGVGIGTTYGAFILMGEHNTPWGFGLIPMFVGIAYLISYFVEQKNKKQEGDNE
jgi:hypothetical protein